MTLKKPIRARSDAAKKDRRLDILEAARGLLADKGFQGVTMNGLARRAGLAKGTLYLYFKTREEVFLTLHSEATDRVIGRITSDDRTGQSPGDVARAVARAARSDPLFFPLGAQLTAVIEQNVSAEALVEAKRRYMDLSARLAAHLGAVLDLPPTAALRLTSAVALALQGAAQLSVYSGDMLGGLPEEVAAFVDTTGSEATLTDALTVAIEGVRAGL
jgi:AcrR family transcriptional regulator